MPSLNRTSERPHVADNSSVPIDETRGVSLLQGIRAGLEEPRVHPGLIHLDDFLVLRAGGFPQPGEAANVVVHAFDGILMHQLNHARARHVRNE